MELLEVFHIVCAVLWLGNFVLTGLWSVRAFRTKDRALQHFAAGEILFTDAIFTLVFGTAVTVTGMALAAAEHIDLWHTRWTATALALVIVAGVGWLAVLVPAQFAMLRLTRAEGNAARVQRAFLRWNIAGWAITLVLFFVIYLMVAKPA